MDITHEIDPSAFVTVHPLSTAEGGVLTRTHGH
jgi:hypothetical protein